MNILITGASGFIGRNLVYTLRSEHDVIALCRTVFVDDSVMNITKDINDISKEDIENVDVIVHCASTIDNSNIFSNPGIDYEVNCLGTIRLLDMCRQFNKSVKIIFTSTFFAVGNDKKSPTPLSLYGASKLSTEHICSVYNNVFDMNIIVCRLSNVYGVGERLDNKKAALNRMIYNAVHGIAIDLFNEGSDIRDYVYIDDCVSALISLMERGVRGKVYEIGSGIGISMRDICQLIKNKIPSVVINNKENINPMNIKSYCSDISFMNAIGWNPDISLNDGIDKIIEWYKGDYRSLL